MSGEMKALNELLALIRDDGYAISFQTYGQYRTSLINEVKRLARGLDSETVTGNAEAMRYRAERAALQLRLNVTDQRNDELMGLLQMVRVNFNPVEPDPAEVECFRQIDAALKPATEGEGTRAAACPFCGGPGCTVITKADYPFGQAPRLEDYGDDGLAIKAEVFCHSCGSEGPCHEGDVFDAADYVEAERLAVEYWNTRGVHPELEGRQWVRP